ncbi:unnamed protein product [Auanema sp. JU1783]|nr:unnamed protein product [Auanema sp. JU1783]
MKEEFERMKDVFSEKIPSKSAKAFSIAYANLKTAIRNFEKEFESEIDFEEEQTNSSSIKTANEKENPVVGNDEEIERNDMSTTGIESFIVLTSTSKSENKRHTLQRESWDIPPLYANESWYDVEPDEQYKQKYANLGR